MRHKYHHFHFNKLTRFETIVIILLAVEPIMNVPQIIKLYTTESAGDFYIWTWVVGFLANLVWFVYGLNVKKAPIIISSIAWMLIHLSMTVGIILYG